MLNLYQTIQRLEVESDNLTNENFHTEAGTVWDHIRKLIKLQEEYEKVLDEIVAWMKVLKLTFDQDVTICSGSLAAHGSTALLDHLANVEDRIKNAQVLANELVYIL